MNVLNDKFAHFRSIFATFDKAIVAFSGGVDSSFVLKVAHDQLGDRVVALTTTSPTMPEQDRLAAVEFTARLGVRHLVIESNELEIPGYANNPLNRCYLCKHNLFTVCSAKAREMQISTVLDGLNLDDLHDYRPGIKAAAELEVRHPLVEAELTKDEIRTLSRELGLATWDRPASPCLSSRFPYGTLITEEGLRKVERGEQFLRELGFAVARVRYHGDVARLEVETREIPRLLDPAVRERVDAELKRLGFRFVTVDLKGFRSGSLNEGLTVARPAAEK